MPADVWPEESTGRTIILFDLDPGEAWEAYLSFAIDPQDLRLVGAGVLRTEPSSEGMRITNAGH